MQIIIVAGNFREALGYAEGTGLRRSEWRYGNIPEHLMGTGPNTKAVTVGSWVRNYAAINAVETLESRGVEVMAHDRYRIDDAMLKARENGADDEA